jgi:hypothetical protein
METLFEIARLVAAPAEGGGEAGFTRYFPGIAGAGPIPAAVTEVTYPAPPLLTAPREARL